MHPIPLQETILTDVIRSFEELKPAFFSNIFFISWNILSRSIKLITVLYFQNLVNYGDEIPD